jgi:hypothetical protein
MRASVLAVLVLNAIFSSQAFAQVPPLSGSGPSKTDDPCSGATAFIEREKARESATHPQAGRPSTHAALSAELEQMRARDQEARRASISSPNPANMAAVGSVDAANLPRLKSIVAQFGFPTLAMVGRDGVQAAWLLTQHADDDPAFQKHVLALIKSAATDDVRPGDVAMLSDRIRIHEGKPQRFGSNFDLRTMKPTPIEDPEHVDERRAQVHLMPMADYTCEMHQFYRR